MLQREKQPVARRPGIWTWVIHATHHPPRPRGEAEVVSTV